MIEAAIMTELNSVPLYRVAMREIILDTNVFVAAGFNRNSASAKILRSIASGELRMIWSDATLRETQMIVEKIPPLSWKDVSDLFRDDARFAGEIDTSGFELVEDADDRKFAALSAASGATLITSDDDLLSVRDRLTVAVLTPSEFLERSKELDRSSL
jgi:uncharacterized protein